MARKGSKMYLCILIGGSCPFELSIGEVVRGESVKLLVLMLVYTTKRAIHSTKKWEA